LIYDDTLWHTMRNKLFTTVFWANFVSLPGLLAKSYACRCTDYPPTRVYVPSHSRWRWSSAHHYSAPFSSAITIFTNNSSTKFTTKKRGSVVQLLLESMPLGSGLICRNTTGHGTPGFAPLWKLNENYHAKERKRPLRLGSALRICKYV
jgi:hypothetical protein